jgi:hypothetical protein
LVLPGVWEKIERKLNVVAIEATATEPSVNQDRLPALLLIG